VSHRRNGFPLRVNGNGFIFAHLGFESTTQPQQPNDQSTSQQSLNPHAQVKQQRSTQQTILH